MVGRSTRGVEIRLLSAAPSMENSASGGGAIGNLRSNLAIYNSSFANNRALDTNGGAVALDGLNPDQGKVFTLCGVIATNNRARIEGGAVYRYGYPDEQSVIDFTVLDGKHRGGRSIRGLTPEGSITTPTPPG